MLQTCVQAVQALAVVFGNVRGRLLLSSPLSVPLAPRQSPPGEVARELSAPVPVSSPPISDDIRSFMAMLGGR
jgi:hypothetical protein